MADPKGFLKVTERELPARRPVPVRIMDWKEVYEPGDSAVLRRQAGRCMDCGIPFCHKGCPLGNLIPERNDLMWRGQGRAAIERLGAKRDGVLRNHQTAADGRVRDIVVYSIIANEWPGVRRNLQHLLEQPA